MHNTVAIVSLERIQSNAKLVSARVPLCAVVKDDAYGHGAGAVSIAIESGVKMFAVATAEEGAALRLQGVTKEILVLTPPVSEEEVLHLSYYGLTATLSSFSVMRLIAETLKAHHISLSAHVAVNTGMNRYGFRPSLLGRALSEAPFPITGAFSHFYLAENKKAREEQYALFSRAVETIKRQLPDAVCHLSATGGFLAGERYDFDMVRSGIALYGYLPKGFAGAIPVKPEMKVYAPVLQSNCFVPRGMGYAKADVDGGYLKTLRFGYGDGFYKKSAEKICMDACVRKGRGNFGRWHLVLKNAEEYAAAHGTSAYEVLVRIGGEAVKYYV